MSETFIKKAKEIHGSKYDYSKVEYKNAKTKVIIICSTHGEFEQQAGSHISNTQPRGCAECGKTSKKNTTEKFIEESIKVHGDKYDYSKTEYITKYIKKFSNQPNLELTTELLLLNYNIPAELLNCKVSILNLSGKLLKYSITDKFI